MSTELREAAKKGDLNAVQFLLGKDVQSGLKSGGKTALSYAAENGHTDVVAFLIQSSSPVDERDRRGRTALMHAIEKRRASVVASLLAHGASANITDSAGWTPLYQALMKKSTNIALALIDAGADCQAINDKGDHALVIAAWLGNRDIVQTLLDRGVPIDGQAAYQALATAINGQHLRIVQALLRSRPDAAREGGRHLSRWLKQTLSAEGQEYEMQRQEMRLGLMEIVALPTDAELAKTVRSLKRDYPETLVWLSEHGVDVNPKGREAREAFVKTVLRENASLPTRIAQAVQRAMTEPDLP